MDSSRDIFGRFQELLAESNKLEFEKNGSYYKVKADMWSKWTMNILNLLKFAHGDLSDFYLHFKMIIERRTRFEIDLKEALGIFKAAKENYEIGFFTPQLAIIEANIPKMLEVLNNDFALSDVKKDEAIKQVEILRSELAKEENNRIKSIINDSITMLSNIASIVGLFIGLNK